MTKITIIILCFINNKYSNLLCFTKSNELDGMFLPFCIAINIYLLNLKKKDLSCYSEVLNDILMCNAIHSRVRPDSVSVFFFISSVCIYVKSPGE